MEGGEEVGGGVGRGGGGVVKGWEMRFRGRQSLREKGVEGVVMYIGSILALIIYSIHSIYFRIFPASNSYPSSSNLIQPPPATSTLASLYSHFFLAFIGIILSSPFLSHCHPCLFIVNGYIHPFTLTCTNFLVDNNSLNHLIVKICLLSNL